MIHNLYFQEEIPSQISSPRFAKLKKQTKQLLIRKNSPTSAFSPSQCDSVIEAIKTPSKLLRSTSLETSEEKSNTEQQAESMIRTPRKLLFPHILVNQVGLVQKGGKRNKLYSQGNSPQSSLSKSSEQNYWEQDDAEEISLQNSQLSRRIYEINTPTKVLNQVKFFAPKQVVHLPLLTAQRQQIQKQINISYEFKRYTVVRSRAKLELLYKDKYIDQHKNAIVVNFENVIQGYTQSFFDDYSFENSCSSKALGSCSNIVCSCKIWNSLKNVFKLLSKQALIVLIFNTKSNCLGWIQYLQKSQFQIDLVYCLNFQSNKINGVLQLDIIRRDSGVKQLESFIFFDSLDRSFNQQNIIPDYFQYKLPQGNNASIIHAIFVISKEPAKLQDSRVLLDICNMFLTVSTELNSPSVKDFVNLDLTPYYDYYSLQEHNTSFNKAAIFELQRNVSEMRTQSEQYINYNWINDCRDNIVFDVKSMCNYKIPQIHYTVGDLVARNDQIYQDSQSYWVPIQMKTYYEDIQLTKPPYQPEKVCNVNSYILKI